MTILFAGGEDIEFPDRTTGGMYTSSGFRTDYARASIDLTSDGYIRCPTVTPFSSAWLTFHWQRSSYWGNNNFRVGGLRNYSTDDWIGFGCGDSGGKVCIFKDDGSSLTTLAISNGAPVVGVVTLYRFDLQVLNYGTNGTVNVFVNNDLTVSYTGNIAFGETTLDQLEIRSNDGFAYASGRVSEVILADEDTRLMSLKTLTPNAAGDTNDWTGAYTDIDEIIVNDADTISTDTAEQDAQFNLTSLPAGNFDIKAVIATARMADGLGTLDAQLGIKTNGSVNLGSTITLDSGWQTFQQMWTQNPITASPFTISEINSLQAMVRSKSK
jgi:hypothetical protein